MKCGSVAQLGEQRPEEPCVDGSSPPGATIFDNNVLLGAFFVVGLCNSVLLLYDLF